MKSLLNVVILIALVGISAAVYGQGDTAAKHAINTKGAGANDRALPGCAPVEPAVVTAAQERQKTKTKSNNPNDRTAAPSVRVLQAGCAEAAPVGPGQSITFTWKKLPDWIKPSFDGKDLRLTIWRVDEGQTLSEAMADAGRRSFQKSVGFADRFDMEASEVDRLLRRPRDVSTSFVWEIQPLDAAGKPVGSPTRATYDLATLKK